MKLFEKDLKNFGVDKNWTRYLLFPCVPFVAYLTMVITVSTFYYGL